MKCSYTQCHDGYSYSFCKDDFFPLEEVFFVIKRRINRGDSKKKEAKE